MNNKKIGSDFEKAFCEYAKKIGHWVHFLNPDNTGAQPFDVISVKDGVAYAIDCKTCANKYFSINRLQDNQIMAFEKWLRCGNTDPLLAVEHDGDIYIISYTRLKALEKINLEEEYAFCSIK